MKQLFLILVTLTAVLNGSHFWMTRTGLINTAAYDALIHKNAEFNRRTMAFINQPETITQDVESTLKRQYLDYKQALYKHLYSNSPLSMVLKSLKYLLYLLSLGLVFFYAGISGRQNGVRRVALVCGLFLLFYATLSFIHFGVAGVIAGLSSCVFLTFLIFSRDILNHDDMRFFALLLLMTIGLLLILAPVELARGIQIFNTSSFLKIRMTGFMDQPTTMGVYLVCIFSFFIVLYRSELGKTGFIMLTAATLVLVILCGSNTAALVLCVVLLSEYLVKKSLTPAKPENWILAMLAAVILSLIFTQGRPLLDSLTGRLDKYFYYLSLDLTPLDYLFGLGLGAGSNTLVQLQSIFAFEQLAAMPSLFSVDSTPLLLIMQTGIIGCAALYGLIIFTLIRDKNRRPAYLAFTLCSLTVNIIEIFPLNIVFALLLSINLISAPPETGNQPLKS